MSIIFSRKCEYALQAVSYLALKPRGELTSIKELSNKLKVPYHFLGKILQNLVYKKILVSQKGKNGGFALAVSADKITLYQIVEAVDGDDFLKRCVVGFPKCSEKNHCAVHNQWGKLREGIFSMLNHENIEEMVKKINKLEYKV